MMVTAHSFLLVLVLGCNVTAEILQTVAEEKQQVPLPCPGPVEGTVTWSRERDGDKVDLIAVDGDRDIRHNDPGRRYSLQADKTLVIVRAVLSDSGRFFCNNEPAVDLTVIPSGTVKQRAAERSSVTLRCPPGVSDGPTWSRETAGKKKRIREGVSTVDKTLTMTKVKPGDSGLYHCDGKPAVYLRVVQRDRDKKTTPTTTTTTPTTTTPTTTTTTPTTTTTMTPTTTTTTTTPTTTTMTPTTTTTMTPTTTTTMTPTTTTTTTTPTTTTPTTTTTTPTTTTPTTTTMTPTTTTPTTTTPTTTTMTPTTTTPTTTTMTPTTTTPTTTTIISTTSMTTTTTQTGLVPGLAVAFLVIVIIIVIMCYLTWRRRSKRRAATYSMVTFTGAPDQNDPTYSTINDLPPTRQKTETCQPTNSPYSLIGNTSLDPNNKGSMQLPDNTYCLLEIPKAAGNNNNQ